MIPIIGVIVCLYVFVRCVEIASRPHLSELLKAISGLVAIASLAGVGLLIRAGMVAQDAMQSVQTSPFLLP